MINKDQINNLAKQFHLTWWEEAVENNSKFMTNGCYHGRFRPFKSTIGDGKDDAFVKRIEWEEEGIKDEDGSITYNSKNCEPKTGYSLYQKKVTTDGKTTYYVDSAIKGFGFLPPSWQEDNLVAAKFILEVIEDADQRGVDFARYRKVLGARVHGQWMFRQLASNLPNATEDELTVLGHYTARGMHLLSQDEVEDLFTSEKAQESRSVIEMTQKDYEERPLYVLLNNLIAEGKLEPQSMAWSAKNFVSFDKLPQDEQDKDMAQVDLGMKVLGIKTDNR